MAISSLQSAGLVDVKMSKGKSYSDDLTLAFALDSGYLECMKVMLVSMAKNGVLCDCPIAIYTDDEDLLEDPVIKLVADKKVLISGTKKEIIYSLAKNNVKRPEKLDWNRGTFLKWSVFEPQLTNRLLFLDVDVLVLDQLDHLLNMYPGKPLVTSPQFQQSLKEGSVSGNLHNMLNGQFDSKHIKRINSGMMLVNSDFLSNDFFSEITSFAGASMAIHEQGHLSNYFSKKSNLLGMAPSTYNFQDSYLRLLTGETYKNILNDIAVLHYAGGDKPWKSENEALLSYASIALWHEYKGYAQDVLKYC
jgi:lipopolysaccharide biosynthesis glycosyltransferase